MPKRSCCFPFEETTTMRMGPTEVMRGEHKQLRALLDAGRAALAARDEDEFTGNGETLLIMMQQHNVKRERALSHATSTSVVSAQICWPSAEDGSVGHGLRTWPERHVHPAMHGLRRFLQRLFNGPGADTGADPVFEEWG